MVDEADLTVARPPMIVGAESTAGGVAVCAMLAGMALACTGEMGPGRAVKLAFTGQPSDATAGVAINPPVQVAIQDESGATVSRGTAADSVALTLAQQGVAGGVLLFGTTTVNAVNGVVTFSALSIKRAGRGYTLFATAPGLASATSTAFAVMPAAPVQLGFTVEPGCSAHDPCGGAQAGLPITPPPEVAIQDMFGNTVTSAAAAVTVTLGTNTGGGTLSGTTTMNTVNGVAIFANLIIDRPGGYTLVATGGTLTGAGSAPFGVR